MTFKLSKVTSKSVAVLGFHSGSAGQVETWFEKETGFKIACFVHESSKPLLIDIEKENSKRISQKMDYPILNTFKKYPFLVSETWLEVLLDFGIKNVLPLTHENDVRYRQIQKCKKAGLNIVSAIHPSVIILPGAEIDQGVWINAGSIIGYKSEIEAGVIINTGCQIDHHNVLKSSCQLAPGVATAGHVTIWQCSSINTRAVVTNKIQIGKYATVGAGAVVLENVPEFSTVVGVPARIIKYNNMNPKEIICV